LALEASSFLFSASLSNHPGMLKHVLLLGAA